MTEIMISSVLLSLVILITWTGMISALNMSLAAQAKTSRKVELNTAMDLLTDEIRHAQATNQSGNVIPDGVTTTLNDVVTHGGVDLDDLGSYGDIALYLEMPFESEAPSICPANSENENKPPIGPSTYDPVVYDIRPSPNGWLTPNAVMRYGRMPELDGSINPCSNPIAGDIIADALSDEDQTSSACEDGIVSGRAGFQTCLTGSNVELLFKSSIAGVEVTPTATTVTPRTVDVFPATPTPTLDNEEPTLSLGIEAAGASNIVEVNWSWSNETDLTQKMKWYRLAVTWPNGSLISNVSSADNEFSFNASKIPALDQEQLCFSLEALSASGETITSNSSCLEKQQLKSPTPILDD